VEIHTKGIPLGGGWNPNTAVTFPGKGRFHPDGLAYVFDSGTDFKVWKDWLEVENCRHIAFGRSFLAVTVNGQFPSEGESRGRLEMRRDDCSVIIPLAEIRCSG